MRSCSPETVNSTNLIKSVQVHDKWLKFNVTTGNCRNKGGGLYSKVLFLLLIITSKDGGHDYMTKFEILSEKSMAKLDELIPKKSVSNLKTA